MKKILLGTSALLVAGMVSATANAAPVKLSVGGYANWYTGYVDANNHLEEVRGKNYEHVPVVGEVEVHFKGETTLQNGLKFGAVIELTGISGADKDMEDTGIDEDQSYIYSDTAAGRFAIGKMDSISKQLHKSSKDVGLLDIQGSDVGKLVPHAGRSVEFVSTDIRTMDDDATIAYFSPKFFGVTIAASYSNHDADATHNIEGNNVAYSTVVAYNNTFGKVTLDADVGYTRYDKDEYLVGLFGTGSKEYDVNAGFRVGVAGFTVGGGYKYGNGKDSLSDWHTFDAGVAYETGPYGVSLSYINENIKTDVLGKDDWKTQMVLGSFGYEITEGVKSFASVAWVGQKGYTEEKANAYVIAGGLGLTF